MDHCLCMSHLVNSRFSPRLCFCCGRVTQMNQCPRFYVMWRTARWCSSTGGTSWWRRALLSQRRAHRRSGYTSELSYIHSIIKEIHLDQRSPDVSRCRIFQSIGVWIFTVTRALCVTFCYPSALLNTYSCREKNELFYERITVMHAKYCALSVAVSQLNSS